MAADGPLGRLVLVLRQPADEAAWIGAIALRAGVGALEVTMSEPDWELALQRLLGPARESGAHVGVGSARSAEDVQHAARAGAAFVATPGRMPGAAAAARAAGVLLVEGAATAGEAIAAASDGADYVKLFPAAQLGGPAFVRALRGPLPDIRFAPSGGIGTPDARAYLEAGAALVGVGTSAVPADVLAERDAHGAFEALAALVRRCAS